MTHSTSGSARRFWGERARDDAFFAVDSRQAYGDPDHDTFWTEGERDLDTLLSSVGAELRPDYDVVEIGCGVGRLTRVLARRVASVRALDVSEEMLRSAAEHNPALENVEWILGDGESLAVIASASADAVVSHVVFQHIPDPAITLGYVRDIGRVLRPRGWAAFQVSNDPAVHRRQSRPARALTAIRSLGRRPWHESAYWRGSAVELPALRGAAAAGSMRVEAIAGEGTQYCLVRAVRESGD